jgi:hypothetical protein
VSSVVPAQRRMVNPADPECSPVVTERAAIYVLTCEECGKHARRYKTLACYRTTYCPNCQRKTEHA